MFAGSLNSALADRRACWPTGSAYRLKLLIASHCLLCIFMCLALTLMNQTILALFSKHFKHHN